MLIEVYADIICPWCYVGQKRLQIALAGADYELRYLPFQLDPSTPPEGDNIGEMLRHKYGRDPAGMWAVVEAAARESGFTLDLKRQPNNYPTLRAHTLLRHAKEQQPALMMD